MEERSPYINTIKGNQVSSMRAIQSQSLVMHSSSVIIGFMDSRFEKAIKLYLSKYKLDIPDLLVFIQKKVQLEEGGFRTLKQCILGYKHPQDTINEDQLRDYFHLIAAHQAKVNIKGKDLSTFKPFTNLKFIKSKSKEVKDNKESKKEQEKKEEHIEEGLYPSVGSETPKKEAAKPVENAKPSEPKEPQKPSPNKYKSQLNLNIIDEDIHEHSASISMASPKMSATQELMLSLPEAKVMEPMQKKQVFISGYDKFGQNYLTPIIKYHIHYADYEVYRRYSQFDNLMNLLNRRYQGFILPQLPPKEGIKSNLSYFWGVDEAFLNHRQQKLEDLLNGLLGSKHVRQDQELLRFLKQQEFELQSGQNTTLSYMQSVGSMNFSASDIKTYGMAYYNYLRQFRREDVNSVVIEQYKLIEPLVQQCLEIEGYRSKINSNFEQRRELFLTLAPNHNHRNTTVTDFDKMSAQAADSINNLSKEIGKYLDLKAQANWLSLLIRQKQVEHGADLESLKGQQQEIDRRIWKMEENLCKSIEELRVQKQAFLAEACGKMVEWRRRVHP